MNKENRVRILLGITAVLALVAVIVQYSNRPGVKPPPSASGYYTGPMKSKGGDPTVYGTDDGKQVPAPPGSAAATAAAQKPKTAGPGVD